MISREKSAHISLGEHTLLRLQFNVVYQLQGRCYNSAIAGIIVTILVRIAGHKGSIWVKSLCCGVNIKLNIIVK